MAYIKNTWVDREGTTRYFETVDEDGALIFTPDYTQVTELGTPVNADNMNHIEDGIAAGSFTKYDTLTVYQKDDLVTFIVDNEPKIYRSLTDNNVGNSLQNGTFWEEISLGGGGGAFSLFDTKLLDRVLSYKETKGWALQGTYVYKEAVAGSRYGYPDFYNKCVDEKDLGVATETVLGENTITLYTNANGHTFYDIADKEAIDAWYSTYGIAWYYGVDAENERIFLPRTKWFIQPSGEITEVNTVNEAGLPNITGKFSIITALNRTGSSGAFSHSTKPAETGGLAEGGAFGYHGATEYDINASRSSSIYGNSDTVQPPSINQLLYICVGNTNVESAVTDVVDVTTTENDTVPLGYSTYQNGTQPNVSWLKSQGQWNDGNVYTTFYNEFVQKIGQPFASGYVKEITEEYDDYDLVINQDDMTFRLPLLDGSESVVDNSNVTMICDDVTSFEYTVQQNGVIRHRQRWKTDASGSQTVNLSLNGFVYPLSSNYAECTLYNIQVKKGDVVSFTSDATTLTVVQYFVPYKGNGSLYFKVANAVQNLELLDAGEVLESLTGKADISASNFTAEGKSTISSYSFPSNKYIDLTLNASGATYTAPANGWFYVDKTATAANQYIKFAHSSKGYGDSFSSYGSSNLYAKTEVTKGEVITIIYNAGGKTNYFRFIYAQGEV